MTMDFEKRLQELASWFGLKATFVEEIPQFAYVPGHIRYVGSTPESRISNLAHDLAHFIVACPSRRRISDFGLGDGPDSLGPSPRPRIWNTYHEELHASALGTTIELWAGHYPSWTMLSHGWNEGERSIDYFLARLAKRNLFRPRTTVVEDPFRQFRFSARRALRHVKG